MSTNDQAIKPDLVVQELERRNAAAPMPTRAEGIMIGGTGAVSSVISVWALTQQEVFSIAAIPAAVMGGFAGLNFGLGMGAVLYGITQAIVRNLGRKPLEYRL
ncbi:MAG: hypothetical protein WAO98_03105 [Alphaproteobacteria bacterium]